MSPAILDLIRKRRPVSAHTHVVHGRCDECGRPVTVRLQTTVCTVAEAAEILDCSGSQLYEMIADGRIPTGVWFGLGRLRRIWVERLLEWMERGGTA